MGISALPSSNPLVGETERTHKREMSLPRKDLREEIGEIICRLYAEDLNIPIGDAFADIMLANVDVFDASVAFSILRERSGPHVIAVEDCRLLLGHGELPQEAVHPHGLLRLRVNATYSASTVESATVACFFDDHDTGPPDIMKTLPDVERRVSKSPA
jgi:hypothetical protein